MFNEKYKNGILIALIICLLSSVTFIKFDSDSIIEYNVPLDRPKNVCKKIDIGKAASLGDFVEYTYATAPEKVRRIYAEKCKALGITPKDSDKIEIPSGAYNELTL
ncbi:hypothetical protein [Clostridioides sp. ZZV14-5902]